MIVKIVSLTSQEEKVEFFDGFRRVESKKILWSEFDSGDQDSPIGFHVDFLIEESLCEGVERGPSSKAWKLDCYEDSDGYKAPMVILTDCEVYLMGNDGKTIERLRM